jgi:putative aminopeptidase FrvX
MKALVKELVEAYGPSGVEEHIRATIKSKVSAYADDIRTDPLGSLVIHKTGTPGSRRVIVAAHMDEIGVIVTYIDEKGFARFAPVGGLSPLTCIGARVVFEDGTVGVIGIEKRDDKSKAPKFEHMYIDCGATTREEAPVGVGSAGVFVRPFVAQGARYIAKAMDDRIGCAVLIEMLRRLETTTFDLYAVFSVQEETTLSGARTSAYGIEPDMAIAVDVTLTGDTPECAPMAVELGKGPAIKVQDRGMIAHPMVKGLLIERAQAANIPYQLEVLERGTTDAAAIQLVRSGVASGCVSIPCRYVHTPSEMVDANDVENAVRLLLEVVTAE